MKNTKLFSLLTLLLLSVTIAFDGSAQIDTPALSPSGSSSTKVGLTDIEISYSRPQMKGREIFGTGDDFLVPFGKRWRAGANAGTIITFSTDVKVAGTDVPAGDYLLILTPDASKWEIILYSDVSLGSSVNETEDDKITVKTMVSSSKLTEAVEMLTYQVTDITEDSKNANIQMAWENTALNIPVSVSFDDLVMQSIAENTVVLPSNYMAAANYYCNNDKDLEQALEWVNIYLGMEKSSKEFWNIHTKAKILGKMGNKKEAIEIAKESKKLAKASERGDFGYIKKNDDLIKSLK